MIPYNQTLYSIVNPIRTNTLIRMNKKKAWEYGYNKEHNIVVISKTGEIGEVYEIQNLKIALPKAPSNIPKGQNKWEADEYPKELKQIKNIFEWDSYPKEFKDNQIYLNSDRIVFSAKKRRIYYILKKEYRHNNRRSV